MISKFPTSSFSKQHPAIWTIDYLSGRRNVFENFSDWSIISSPDAAARFSLQNFSL
jgi:hypothetical protein